jgi:hypothetical protein
LRSQRLRLYTQIIAQDAELARSESKYYANVKFYDDNAYIRHFGEVFRGHKKAFENFANNTNVIQVIGSSDMRAAYARLYSRHSEVWDEVRRMEDTRRTFKTREVNTSAYYTAVKNENDARDLFMRVAREDMGNK